MYWVYESRTPFHVYVNGEEAAAWVIACLEAAKPSKNGGNSVTLVGKCSVGIVIASRKIQIRCDFGALSLPCDAPQAA